MSHSKTNVIEGRPLQPVLVKVGRGVPAKPRLTGDGSPYLEHSKPLR